MVKVPSDARVIPLIELGVSVTSLYVISYKTRGVELFVYTGNDSLMLCVGVLPLLDVNCL